MLFYSNCRRRVLAERLDKLMFPSLPLGSLCLFEKLKKKIFAKAAAKTKTKKNTECADVYQTRPPFCEAQSKAETLTFHLLL